MSKIFEKAWFKTDLASSLFVATLSAVLLAALFLPLWLTKAVDGKNLVALDNGILVSDKEVNFGGVTVNKEETLSFTIANPLNKKLTLQLETETKEFEIVGGDKITLEPQETRRINLKFAPNKIGKKDDNLKIAGAQLLNSSATVSLLGRGLASSYGDNFFSTLKIIENHINVNSIQLGESLLIDYRLNSPSHVTVTIQQDNRVIKTVADYSGLKLEDLVTWDGTDNLGRTVSPGTYRYVIDAFSDSSGVDTAFGEFTVKDSGSNVAAVGTDQLATAALSGFYTPSKVDMGQIVEIVVDFNQETTADLQILTLDGQTVSQLWQGRNVGVGLKKAFWQPKESGNYLVKLQTTTNQGVIPFVSAITVNPPITNNNDRQIAEVITDQTAVSNEIAMPRAEAMAYLVKELGLKVSLYRPESDLNLGFADLDSETWLLSPFKTLIKTGWVPRLDEYGVQFKRMIEGAGLTGVVLEPERYLNRAELYKIFVEGLMNREEGTTLKIDRNPKVFCFKDLVNNADSRWYLPYAQFACNELRSTEIAKKYHADNNFGAAVPVTRDYLETLLRVGRSKAWW